MTDPATDPTQPIIEPLTRREREILALLAQGLFRPEITLKLTLAVSSVKGHAKHLDSKLVANSKRQALTRAREPGLLATQAGRDAGPASASSSRVRGSVPYRMRGCTPATASRVG